MKLITTIVGTCSICEREIAVQRGDLVHHGYQRPGYGFIQGDCFGVGYAPYERSTRACLNYQALAKANARHLQEEIAKLESGATTYLVQHHYRPYGSPSKDEFALGVTDPAIWAYQVKREITRLKAEKNLEEYEVGRMNGLLERWELRELGSETRAGAKERAEREARAKERAEKKAVRDAKRAALDAKNAAKKERAEALQAKYKEQLEALVEKAVATDAVNSPATRAAALALFAAFEKEAKGGKGLPVLHFHVQAFKWDHLLLQVGLAHREANDWLRLDIWTVN